MRKVRSCEVEILIWEARKKFVIHEANISKTDPATLLFNAKNPSTAKAECLCEIVKNTVEWNFYNLEISILFFKKSSPKEEQKNAFSNLKYIALRKKLYNIMLFYRMLFKTFNAKRTRHFRVILYLCFKTSPRAKSFTSTSV